MPIGGSAPGVSGPAIKITTNSIGDADFIVTGDRKHLLKLGQYKKIKIVEASTFMSQFAGNPG